MTSDFTNIINNRTDQPRCRVHQPVRLGGGVARG